MRASLAEVTEGAEGKILFVCPGEFSGQTRRLFWRIGLSPILQNSSSFATSLPTGRQARLCGENHPTGLTLWSNSCGILFSITDRMYSVPRVNCFGGYQILHGVD